MAQMGRTSFRPMLWRRGRDANVEVARIDPTVAAAARRVRQHLTLTNVRCVLDGPTDSIAAAATVQLVFVNDGEDDVEYHVDSLTAEIQHRIVTATNRRSDMVVHPGEATMVCCPTIRGVDRTGVSSGNVEFAVVYGHPSAPSSLRYRRQQGIWFRFEADGEGHTQLRFVERYDEDDPLT
jgi:hypothetical protein